MAVLVRFRDAAEPKVEGAGVLGLPGVHRGEVDLGRGDLDALAQASRIEARAIGVADDEVAAD